MMQRRDIYHDFFFLSGVFEAVQEFYGSRDIRVSRRSGMLSYRIFALKKEVTDKIYDKVNW